jgi:hypothetical protein
MGTDTMGYCASALSFLCENLNKPVIMTGAMVGVGDGGEGVVHRATWPHGAQVPMANLLSDAQRNMFVALVRALPSAWGGGVEPLRVNSGAGGAQVLAATLDIPEVAVFINDKLMRGNRTVKVRWAGACRRCARVAREAMHPATRRRRR